MARQLSCCPSGVGTTRRLPHDNGQTDPSISSLFDLWVARLICWATVLLSALHTIDRRHVVNGFLSSVTPLVSLAVKDSLWVRNSRPKRTPLNTLAAHGPVYGNGGEVPIGAAAAR